MRIVVFSCIVAALAACDPSLAPSGPPIITGAIVARDVTISIGGAPTVHVKEEPASECGIIFLVTPETRIWRSMADGKFARASASDLTVGRRVAVWAEVVMESCPGQSSATTIRILE